MTEPQPVKRQSENRLYALLIKPKQSVQNLRNREIVLNVVLVGTGLLTVVLLALLLVSFFTLGNHQVVSRIVVAVVGAGFTATLLWLSRRLHYKLAAYLLTLFYFLIAVGSVASWGIGNPFGILLLALVIILAGILISARHGLYTAAAASVVMFWVQSSVEAGWITLHQPVPLSSLGDAAGYTVLFGMIAVISWLFGARMEHSLIAAETAEAALEHEKSQLQVRLKKYATRLQKAQMDEMRQLYQFAEVGQLSTSLLHDLANHLSVLNLEIDGMRGNKQQAQSISRSRAIVAQLDIMLDEVRSRLAGQKTSQTFSLVNVISEAVVRCLRNYSHSGVQIDWQVPTNARSYNLVGDPLKCGQIIAILLRNACDAYAKKSLPETERPRIAIAVKRSGETLEVSITDWGVGIPADKRQDIFRPDYTTKRAGMGIGLYLARQMAITEFGGNLRLADAANRTEFVITFSTNAR